ncbi:MAG: hypothetical protein HOL09_04910, partial [Candidatus Marinimicrobia bacterium]|nr:hypothetical protein [Candidatus Neomarinimicrobiota bacterium]
MKKYIFGLLFISIILSQNKTQDISGTILDIDNLEPLPYANVVVIGIDRGITSNSDGQFVLVDIPAEPC